jgi:hypothetical protein
MCWCFIVSVFRPDTWDLIQSGDLVGERGQVPLDLPIDRGQVGVDRVHPCQHAGEQEPVVVIEAASERLLQGGQLASPRSWTNRTSEVSREPWKPGRVDVGALVWVDGGSSRAAERPATGFRRRSHT